MTVLSGNPDDNYFSAQPKVLNLDFVHDRDEMPTPLSFKRNGDNINEKHDRMSVPDEDKGGKYFGASLRMGPFMTVQEDRVSKNLLYFWFLTYYFFYSSLSKKNSKAQTLTHFMPFSTVIKAITLLIFASKIWAERWKTYSFHPK